MSAFKGLLGPETYSGDAQELFDHLTRSRGCAVCPDNGVNGCGSWRIGTYEFEFCDNGEVSAAIDTHEDMGCYYPKKRLQELEKERERGTMVFTAAIQAALELAPSGEAKVSAYGDIVRSAAAVAVSRERSNGDE